MMGTKPILAWTSDLGGSSNLLFAEFDGNKWNSNLVLEKQGIVLDTLSLTADSSTKQIHMAYLEHGPSTVNLKTQTIDSSSIDLQYEGPTLANPIDIVSPEPLDDSDGDGIPDSIDSCPTQAETVNGHEDNDGCPDSIPPRDSDSDGIPDSADKCPTQAETVNGHEDDDGCPDSKQVEKESTWIDLYLKKQTELLKQLLGLP